MINSYKSFWTRAFDYEGVTTRSDYWLAVLANAIVGALIGAFSGGIDSAIYIVFAIASFIAGFSMVFRRLRDMGKPWNWIFILFIPLVGSIWLVVLLCQPSVPIT
tara:strand:+ start:78 stop:392 length:315 start_codon:yes stop_codon:yes gene_type:complete